MANRAEMITLILKRLGVVGAGQAQNPEDTSLVGTVLDSVHARLEKEGLLDFPLIAVPMEAEIPLRDVVAPKLVGDFGIDGTRLQEILASAATGGDELASINEGENEQVDPEYF